MKLVFLLAVLTSALILQYSDEGADRRFEKALLPLNVSPVKRELALPFSKIKQKLGKLMQGKNQTQVPQDDDCDNDPVEDDQKPEDDCDDDDNQKPDDFNTRIKKEYDNRKRPLIDPPYDSDTDSDGDWKLPTRIVIHEGNFTAGEEDEYIDYIRTRCKEADVMYWNNKMGLFNWESLTEDASEVLFEQNAETKEDEQNADIKEDERNTKTKEDERNNETKEDERNTKTKEDERNNETKKDDGETLATEVLDSVELSTITDNVSAQFALERFSKTPMFSTASANFLQYIKTHFAIPSFPEDEVAAKFFESGRVFTLNGTAIEEWLVRE